MHKRTWLVVGWSMATLAVACTNEGDWTNCCDTMFRADPQLFQDSFDQKKYPPGNYKGTFSGYWLTLKGGAVTKVEEQYFP